MLNSAELEIFLLIIVCILTFMSRINDLLLGLKPEISIVFAIIFKVYGQLKFSCSAELSMISFITLGSSSMHSIQKFFDVIKNC